MPRNYVKKSEPTTELAEIIRISNSDIEVFEDIKSFYKFGEPGELRNQLRSIVKQCVYFVRDFGQKYDSLAFAGGTYTIPQNLYFRIMKNKIVFAPAKIVEILQGVDARRLKFCPVCDRVFWAKRLDSKTCGEKECVEKLSGKTYHDENKDAVNRKKREKYYIENGIKYCKTCVRPVSTCECDVKSGAK